MKKIGRPLVLSVALCLLSMVSFSQFTLTVTNGYGSGNYSSGDTVDI